jgi:hypothetical protein
VHDFLVIKNIIVDPKPMGLEWFDYTGKITYFSTIELDSI